MKKTALFAALAAAFLVSCANAEGIDVEPGKWEMSTKTIISMPGMSMPPQALTVTECVEEEELSPDDFNMDQENPCEISDVAIDGDTAKWSISCPTDMGAMDGQWEFTSKGDSLSGVGSMSANYGGQEMSFKMTWEGKRIGDCD